MSTDARTTGQAPGTAPPTSTYRVQLNAGFTFRDAAALVPYLAELGVSHVYCSPVLQAADGSTHGYDVTDPGRVWDVLGGEAGRQELLAAARTHGLGLVQDVVPNHVSVADPQQSAWWWDVLRRGPASEYAEFFDIDWSLGRLLLPVLGSPDELASLQLVDPQGRILTAADGEPQLRLRTAGGVFPVADGTAKGTAAQVHDQQHYQLAPWTRAAHELGYRRFFDVTSLAGVRVELPMVFDATHALVGRWLAAGELDGLRVDHPDGLADPQAYLRRLTQVGGGRWTVVEKILGPDEALPPSWPVAGTTGYDALRLVDGVFLDQAAEGQFTALYQELTGQTAPWAELVHDCKLRAAQGPLAAETRRLARLAAGSEPPAAMLEALAEVLACFPVYRSYLSDASRDGEEHLQAALGSAAARRPDLAAALGSLAPRLRDPADELCRRLQQTSGMVMAKGVEDTAFYRYHRLASLNEVGGAPDRFGVSVEEFHRAAARRERDWPSAMTTLTTHDTKRSADVRTRLGLLTQLPERWRDTVAALERASAPLHAGVDANLRYLMHQTVVGAWPLSPQRLAVYLEKASREAKEHTSWTEPDARYDASVQALALGVLADPAYVAIVESLLSELRCAEAPALRAHTLLALAQPGVPDIYQGTELEARLLVDPDNRRPVDTAALARMSDPRQHLVRAVLRARRAGLLAPGCGYEQLETATPHALAFRRGADAVVVVGRLLVRLERNAGPDIPLPASPTGRWQDRIGGGSHTTRLPLSVVASQGGVLLVAAPPGA